MNWMIARRLKSIISLTTLTSPKTNLNETILSRQYHRESRSRAENLRKINPKVPYPEAFTIAESLYNVIKQKGPLDIAHTWDLVKEGAVNGVVSKTHMKIMLKWMRGRDMLKQFCTHVGSNKRFLLTTLPEDPNLELPKDSGEPSRQPHKKNKAKAAKLKLRKKIKKEQTQKQKQQQKR